MAKTLSKQASNSLELYKGGNPASIEILLKRQKASVVNELKEYFGTSDTHELAVRLSIGY